jgi:hypothetical protein
MRVVAVFCVLILSGCGKESKPMPPAVSELDAYKGRVRAFLKEARDGADLLASKPTREQSRAMVARVNKSLAAIPPFPPEDKSPLNTTKYLKGIADMLAIGDKEVAARDEANQPDNMELLQLKAKVEKHLLHISGEVHKMIGTAEAKLGPTPSGPTAGPGLP